MRFLILFLSFISIHIGMSAYATVNEYQEQRAEMFCKLNPEVCGELK